jgi:AraC family transcriptional regulator
MHHTEDDKETGLSIRKVLEFIQMNLAEDLSLQRLSEIANYSPFHFQRVFTDAVGESPKQYVIRLRLERIAHYLKVFPGLSISDLAEKSGLTSLSTFSRAFNNYFGVNAEDYRKMTNDEYRMFCKTNSKKCKTAVINTPDLCIRDFSLDEIMEWKNKVDISTKRVQGFGEIYMSTCLDNSDAISLAFRKLCRWAEPRELLSAETRFVGTLLDIPFITSVEKCRYWAGITFPADVKLPKEASVAHIPDGFYANYRLNGNLLTTVKSLAFFNHGWLPQSGYAIKEVMGYEVYSENPANKPSETIDREILIPVRPAHNL